MKSSEQTNIYTQRSISYEESFCDHHGSGYVASLKNRLQISWDAVDEADSYEIEVMMADGSTATYTSSSTTLMVKNSTCPKVYVEDTSTWTAATVRVRAVSGDTLGDWSEAVKIGCDKVH